MWRFTWRLLHLDQPASKWQAKAPPKDVAAHAVLARFGALARKVLQATLSAARRHVADGKGVQLGGLAVRGRGVGSRRRRGAIAAVLCLAARGRGPAKAGKLRQADVEVLADDKLPPKLGQLLGAVPWPARCKWQARTRAIASLGAQTGSEVAPKAKRGQEHRTVALHHLAVTDAMAISLAVLD